MYKYLYTYKIYLYTYKWVYMRFIHLLLSNLIGQNLQPWYNGSNKAELQDKLVGAMTKAQEEAKKVAQELRQKRLKRKRPPSEDSDDPTPNKLAKLDNERDEAIVQRLLTVMRKDPLLFH